MALIKKENNLALDVPTLEKEIHNVELASKSIINAWVETPDVTKILNEHQIDIDLFKSDYAIEILNYYISVVKKIKQIGDCPVISKLLRFFSDKDITSSELFTICTHFRKAIVEYFFQINLMNEKLYSEVAYIFDKNLAGVLTLYSETIFRMQQEIEEHRQIFDQYNLAFNQSALISKTDLDGIITYVNDNFVKISGFSENELLGHNHNIVRHPDTPNIIFENLWKTIKQGNTFRGIIKNRTKLGENYYVDTTILPLLDMNNNIKEFLAVRYDVTELVHARDNAINAERTKDIFLANMSHEIRTPLNAILGFVEILRKQKQSTENQKYLDTIHSSGQSLLTIISDILDFAKLRSGKLEIDKHPFNLQKELQITIDLFKQNAHDKGIKYEVNIDSHLPNEVNADSVRINQILANFLSNAIKFTSEGKSVTTTIRVEKNLLILSVQDGGIGMTEDQQSRIFTAFEQAEKTTTRTHGGTGLGLAISLKLAHNMNGDILLESRENEGSTFTLKIPIEYDKQSLTQANFEQDNSLSSEANNEEEITFEGHILIAEDNKANQMLISLFLEDFGLSFEIANNGKEAYKMYEKDPSAYNLILMDNQMPIMNGVDSTKKIREIEKDNGYKRVPIVALTANALKGDREYFLENDLDEYVKKPIDIAELQRVLALFLKKS